MTVSQWADQNRILPKASAEPGRWRTSRAPYLQGVMDAVADPAIHTIVVVSSAQIGKTEAILNTIGYIIDRAPGPILYLMPTLEMSHALSKDRLAPMVADTPCLSGKVTDPKSKESGNTLLHKIFPGGHITLAGANSPASLASRPVRYAFMDEVDRFPASAGSEGDPVTLAIARTRTFWDRKILMTSTPTVKGLSRIETAYEGSDQRRYQVPCPHCGEFQVLTWSQVVFAEKDERGHRDPAATTIACAHCGCALTEADRLRMIPQGRWVATAPFNGVAGFHLWEIYSPWTSLADMTTRWRAAAREGQESIRVVVNTMLGESYEEAGEQTKPEGLISRVEDYGPAVPAPACVLTAGVDVQKNRLEVVVNAWGQGRESWNMDYRVLHGDTSQPDLWAELDQYLQRAWPHESGNQLRILCTCIDSGDMTDTVYKFTAPRARRFVFPVKGISTLGAPLVKLPSSSGGRKTLARKMDALLHTVNPDQAKRLIYSWLALTPPRPGDSSPGFMHFPRARDAEYFGQLTAEKMVTRISKGVSRREWVKTQPRNEVLDCTVYALAALEILLLRGLNIPNLQAKLNPR